MARKKAGMKPEEVIYPADAQCMELMAKYICDQEEKGEIDPELVKSVVVEAMDRLSVHGLHLFDQILKNERDTREEAGA